MRLIDADALKANGNYYTDEEGYRIFYDWQIDNAPTVEVSKAKMHTCTSCKFFTLANSSSGRCDKKDSYDSFTRARRQRACKLYESKKEATKDD